MKKIMKRVAALLCAVVMVVSILSVPAQAAGWEFRFKPGSSILSTTVKIFDISQLYPSCKWGIWKPVYFEFKGSGIQRVEVSTKSANSKKPVEAYISYVNWGPAETWCGACIMVRGRNGGTGTVYIYLKGSTTVQRMVYIT